MDDFQEFGFQNSVRRNRGPTQPRPAWVNVMPTQLPPPPTRLKQSTQQLKGNASAEVKETASTLEKPTEDASATPFSTTSSASSAPSTTESNATSRRLAPPDGETVYAHIMTAMEEAMEEVKEEEEEEKRKIVPSDGRGVNFGSGSRNGSESHVKKQLIAATGSSRTTSIFGPIVVTGSRRVGDVRISDSQTGRDRLIQVFKDGAGGPNLAGAASEAQTVMARIKTKEAIQGHLDFSSCGLAKIPLDAAATILTYSTIRILDVANNSIDSLPKTLSRSKFCCKLEELLASKNRLSRLPSEYNLFNHLKVIDISYNQFTTFPPVLYEIRSLERILASFNQIAEIDVEKLKTTNNLKEIDLEENPIRSSVLDQIESEIQFQILIRVSEPKEAALAEEMD